MMGVLDGLYLGYQEVCNHCISGQCIVTRRKITLALTVVTKYM